MSLVQCVKCLNYKVRRSFYRRGSGFRSECVECNNKARNARRLKNLKRERARVTLWHRLEPRKSKNIKLKTIFGITVDDYEQILRKQNGVCAICKNPETRVSKKYGKVKDLAVDHDHVNGRIRGLLCDNCNNGLGRFKDCVEYLRSAMLYLEYETKQEQFEENIPKVGVT